MDYRTATKKIALALRKSGVFVSVRLGRDSGNPRRGQEVLVQVSRGEVSQVQTFFEAVTKILKPVGFKPLGWGSGKVWKDIDDTIWVDAEDGYHLKAEEVKTFAIQVREKIIPLNQRKGHLREALQRIANDVPSSRVHLLPILRKHACGCDDGVVAGDLDEMFAGRAYTTPNGPDGAENKKDFGTAPSMGGPGKWKGKKKDKCFYETGDEADRCYVTTNGGPGGQKKPSSGGAGADGSGKRQEYNQKYKKQRWNKGAAERLAELRAKKAGSGAANAKYLDRLSAPAKAKIMKAVARHYGVSIRVMDAELRDPEAEDLYEYLAFDNTMAMQVYRGFKSLRLASRQAQQWRYMAVRRGQVIWHGRVTSFTAVPVILLRKGLLDGTDYSDPLAIVGPSTVTGAYKTFEGGAKNVSLSKDHMKRARKVAEKAGFSDANNR